MRTPGVTFSLVCNARIQQCFDLYCTPVKLSQPHIGNELSEFISLRHSRSAKTFIIFFFSTYLQPLGRSRPCFAAPVFCRACVWIGWKPPARIIFKRRRPVCNSWRKRFVRGLFIHDGLIKLSGPLFTPSPYASKSIPPASGLRQTLYDWRNVFRSSITVGTTLSL